VRKKFLSTVLKIKGWLFIGGVIIALGILFVYTSNPPEKPDKTDPEYKQMKESLDRVRKWLWNHPPDGTNRAERRQRMHVLQKACDQLPGSVYLTYRDAWDDAAETAVALEEEYLALSYLRTATHHTIQDIRKTHVKQGAVVWHLYNMGYVFKTPNACFGIDLHFRNAEDLTEDLDFLLITHSHPDHYTKQLLDAMIAAGKPVITRWYPGSIIVKKPREFMFDTVRVKIDIGDHHYHIPVIGWNNMLMFQIDCGKATHPCTIYHGGDGNRFKKMRPDKALDLFIVHDQFPMDVTNAIHYLQPRITIVSHLMELGHSTRLPFPLRLSFDDAFKELRDIDQDKAIILTWGERWLFPNTILEKN
jgi:hypothetical protein